MFAALYVPRTRLELARPLTVTRPSTWRVYQFHHLGRLVNKSIFLPALPVENCVCKTIKFLQTQIIFSKNLICLSFIFFFKPRFCNPAVPYSEIETFCFLNPGSDHWIKSHSALAYFGAAEFFFSFKNIYAVGLAINY
jgi:hypothetical protein